MRVKVQDTAILNSLEPDRVRFYLSSHGWLERGVNYEGVEAWVFQDSSIGKVTVLVPPSSEFVDFADRMAEVLQRLEKIENRSQLAIFQDISRVDSDVIRIRGVHPTLENGTLPLKAGVNFYSYAYRILLAAACSAVNPQSVFIDKPVKAQDYVDRIAQMDQSEQGSYVIVIRSPLGVTKPNLKVPDPVSIPFNRLVVETLARGLQSLQIAATTAMAQKTTSLQAFEENIEHGISSNLCKALATTSSSLDDGDVIFSINWSGRFQNAKNLPDSISFSKKIMPIIKDAGDFLSELDIKKDYQVEGYVINVGTNYNGTYTIIVSEDLSTQNYDVKMRLSNEDYGKALQAMRSSKRVTCVGDLLKRTKPYLLQTVRNFSIVD